MAPATRPLLSAALLLLLLLATSHQATAPAPAEPGKDGGPACRAKRKGTTLPVAIEMRLLLLALNNF
ncbi:hypothetical protein ACRRTK_014992 [Alexandromys fortis]